MSRLPSYSRLWSLFQVVSVLSIINFRLARILFILDLKTYEEVFGMPNPTADPPASSIFKNIFTHPYLLPLKVLVHSAALDILSISFIVSVVGIRVLNICVSLLLIENCISYEEKFQLFGFLWIPFS